MPLIEIKVVSSKEEGEKPKGSRQGAKMSPQPKGRSWPKFAVVIALFAVALVAGEWLRSRATATPKGIALLDNPAAVVQPATGGSISQPQPVAASSRPSTSSGTGSAQGAGTLPEVVAVVNGEMITREELEREVSIQRAFSLLIRGQDPAPNEALLAQIRTDLLDQVIANRLMLQEATQAGTQVTAQDVQTTLAGLRTQYNLTDQQIRDTLAQFGLTPADLEAWLREPTAINRFISEQVAKGATAAEQQDAIRVWFNDVYNRAQVEVFLGTAGGKLAKVGQPAPDFTMKDLQGGDISLQSFRGQPVLIAFFATWCPPCRYELPIIQQTYEKYKDQGLVVIGVDDRETVAQVEPYVRQLNLTFPIVVDTAGSVINLFRVRSHPTNVFVDHKGVVTNISRGILAPEQLDGYIAQLLQAGSASQ
jgi:peroxiredoxin